MLDHGHARGVLSYSGTRSAYDGTPSFTPGQCHLQMHTFCFSVTAGDSTHDELTSDAFHALTEDEPLAHLHDGLACPAAT